MAWKIVVVEPVRSWLHGLRRTDRGTLRQIAAAIDALEEEGPSLGRPLVDTVRGSSRANLKELRPGSTGASEVRMLFVFDPFRQAVILVGGDKSRDWQGWYRTAIPQAEKAFAEHLRMAREREGDG